jgi:hypothetical protein
MKRPKRIYTKKRDLAHVGYKLAKEFGDLISPFTLKYLKKYDRYDLEVLMFKEVFYQVTMVNLKRMVIRQRKKKHS